MRNLVFFLLYSLVIFQIGAAMGIILNQIKPPYVLSLVWSLISLNLLLGAIWIFG